MRRLAPLKVEGDPDLGPLRALRNRWTDGDRSRSLMTALVDELVRCRRAGAKPLVWYELRLLAHDPAPGGWIGRPPPGLPDEVTRKAAASIVARVRTVLPDA